jgi:hypothetical protein
MAALRQDAIAESFKSRVDGGRGKAEGGRGKGDGSQGGPEGGSGKGEKRIRVWDQDVRRPPFTFAVTRSPRHPLTPSAVRLGLKWCVCMVTAMLVGGSAQGAEETPPLRLASFDGESLPLNKTREPYVSQYRPAGDGGCA